MIDSHRLAWQALQAFLAQRLSPRDYDALMLALKAPLRALFGPVTMAFDAKPGRSAVDRIIDLLAAFKAGHYDVETNRKIDEFARALLGAPPDAPARPQPVLAEAEDAIGRAQQLHAAGASKRGAALRAAREADKKKEMTPAQIDARAEYIRKRI